MTEMRLRGSRIRFLNKYNYFRILFADNSEYLSDLKQDTKDIQTMRISKPFIQFTNLVCRLSLYAFYTTFQGISLNDVPFLLKVRIASNRHTILPITKGANS